MVIGRRELSVIFLAIIALVFYLVLLSAIPSDAQTGGVTISQNDDNEITVDDEIIVDDEITVDDEIIVDDEITVDDKNLQEEPTIIKIPNKPLPPTGGFPVYGTVAGFILMGAGLLGLGVGIRRGQRR